MTAFPPAAIAPAARFIERDMDSPEIRPFLGGRVAVFTNRSPGRTSPNEDAAALIPYSEDSGLLVVADGAGGTRAGREAARLTIEALERSLVEGAAREVPLRGAVLDGIEQANALVTEMGTGAATTVAIAQIRGDVIRPYHVGDSMVLTVGQRGKVKHQIVPHGPVGYAMEAGLLNESDAMTHDERHLISNFVGSSDMRIEIGPRITLAQRDTVVVASDGLSDNLFLEEIIRRVRKGPLDDAARALVTDCRQRMLIEKPDAPSKPDDLTFILYRRDPSTRTRTMTSDA